MLDDAIAFVRSLAAGFTDAGSRFGSSARRWSETAETTRAMWSDQAGREVFHQFLDPHHGLIEGAGPSVAAALEHHDAALGSMGRAADEARRSTAEAGQSTSACERARGHAASARHDIGSIGAEIGRTRSMAQDVTDRLAAIGE